MLEKVLKRLCPCYFGQSDDSDLTVFSNVDNKDSELKRTIRSSDRTGAGTIFDSWKGVLNIIQPQPIYTFPSDGKKAKIKNKKVLLKPPLYWKKTMKDLCSEGPPVFQQYKRKRVDAGKLKNEKKGLTLPTTQNRLNTTVKVNSPPSATAVKMNWFKTESLITLMPFNKKRVYQINSIESSFSDRSEAFSFDGFKGNHRKDWNCLKCQMHPEISHGVILFTAAYFVKKKLYIINIKKLENLSKKGRGSNSYHSVIKLALLPSEKYIKCSKILSNCSSPEVNQDFTFSVKEHSGKVLRFSVFDASVQKQHEAVGHALLTLDNIVSFRPKKFRMRLHGKTQPQICPGNLALSLKYSSEEDKLTIVVERGKNLCLQKEKNVKLNTYVKITVYADGEKIKTKKSIIIFNCRDPNYNSSFTFQIQNDLIDHLSVNIAVRLKGFVNDLTIGRLNFGPFFYIDNQKLTPWGKVFLKKEIVSHWFRMYL